MATGVKPRDEDVQITRSDLDALQDALKDKKFRDMLSDYCQEVSDPANRALFQKEMTQLEKERGYDITFLNPKGGYVIKTSVAGDQKAFINICSNENVGKPSCNVDEVDGRRGLSWQIPYSMIPPRYDYDHNRKRCVIYDVVFHPDTLRMAEANKRFRELVNKTAFDGLKRTYDIHLDDNNCRFPRSQYKGGLAHPAVIRKEDPTYQPPSEEDTENLSPEILEKLYPQKTYSESETKRNDPPVMKKKGKGKAEFSHKAQNGYTVPKYIIKQQKSVEMEDYTYHKDCKQYSAIPSQILVEINLPLLSSTANCTLEVKEKSLSLRSEKPAKYKLDISLPYPVQEECGNAKFDKSKHVLIVSLPVIRRTIQEKSLKIDSGVESEDNSVSEDENKQLIVELSSEPAPVPADSPVLSPKKTEPSEQSFLDTSLAYLLPKYTHNVLDDIVAFTFHVKNTDPDSVKVQKDSNKIYIKFTTVGAGYVPVHYAAIITLDENITFENLIGEAWENNVILQLQLTGEIPQKFHIGSDVNNLMCEYFDVTDIKTTGTQSVESEETQPLVEVTNLGTETNIVVSTVNSDDDEDDIESPRKNSKSVEDSVFVDGPTVTGAKSILRKPMMRCHSESSYGDVASSADYISSDCIPDESSLKKTVRFNNVIAKQIYRYNSSIEGQKKKNQRKKSKKRQLERRKSESEAEEENHDNGLKIVKPKLKSVLKTRHDSGLADTSDAENDSKNSSPDTYNSKTMEFHNVTNNIGNSDNVNTKKSVLNIVNNTDNKEKCDLELKETSSKMIRPKTEPVTCDNIKHKENLYDPNKLNKGQYLEVSFKNDLIFDLDM